MRLRGLIAAMIVLAGLGGALYWSNRSIAAGGSETTPEPVPKVVELQQEDILRLDLQRKGQKTVTLEKDASGNWQLTAPQKLRADEGEVRNLLFALTPLNADRLLEEKAAGFRPYGLEEPSLQLTITARDNKPRKLLFGDETPTGNGVYARLENDPRVFIVAAYNQRALDKGVNDLRDKKPAEPTPAAK
jgi:hypothetical protein